MVTWDESKRLLNIKDHKMDFVGCEAVFDGPITKRGEDVQVISLRKVTKHEAREYFSNLHR